MQQSIYIQNEGYSNPKIVVSKSYKCYLEDIKGRKYIDTTIGNGTHILGHSSPIINNAITQQIDNGLLFTTCNKVAYETAELICNVYPTFGSVVFCNSGSEATMRAARIARAYTKRDKIAIFSGAWHGGNELFMYDHDYAYDDHDTVHKSSGVPDCYKDTVIVLPYNDDEAFDIIEKNKNDLAMIIIEPSQGSNPRDDMGSYLTHLRGIASRHGIVLCFDEIITGFRVGYGGCQEYYNIEADIVTYGKTVGGGLPIGVVAGKKEIISVVGGHGEHLPVFMGGTFSANPLVMQVSKTLLTHLYSNKEKIYPYLNSMGGYLKSEINKYCLEAGIKAHMIGIGSMLRLVHTEHLVNSRKERDIFENNTVKIDNFYNDLLINENIFVNNNRIIFLSLSHDEKIVKQMLSSIIKCLDRGEF
jgi:glutamate-1-semialdehyde 2,1-aminomutase